MKRVGAERVRAALPEAARPLVDGLLAEAERRGLGVHLVGGPVRDFLLGRALRDVDLLVEEEGGFGAAALARRGAPAGARVVEHARFRTARVETAEAHVDLATARVEHYAQPGALPEVRAGTLEEDLRRRDFTVNALAVPLTAAGRRGRAAVVDLERGLADLEARRLRVFHARSFHDDPTRALRAARLAPRLGFRLTRSTHAALRDALRVGAFGAVTGERFRAEVVRLFEDAPLGLDPSRALRLLSDWHVLASLEPGLRLPAEATAPLRRLGRIVAEPPWPTRPTSPWTAGLQVWLAPLEPALRRRVLRRLALRGDPARAIGGFPTRRDGWIRSLERARGRGAVDRTLAAVDEAALLALLASAPPAVRRRILRWVREDRLAPLPVDGDDLVELGLKGPAVGQALARVRSAFLDRDVRSREEALALAAELARRGRG